MVCNAVTEIGAMMLSQSQKVITVDSVSVHEKIERICSRSIKKESKTAALKLAVTMIDLTTLEGKDTVGKVSALCKKAMLPDSENPSIPQVAAVCVYPNHVRTAVKALHGTPIKVAAVATGFPSGNTKASVKIEETKWAVGEGASEIDMVISRGDFLSGKYSKVFDEIAMIKEACGDAHLKVILETGELGSLDQVRKASDLAILAGGDFIKTSTGKIQPAATLPVTLVMLEAIRDHYLRTGIKIGMKPAGGISTAKIALQYLTLVHEVLGTDWLNSDLFRIGASALLNDLVRQLRKDLTGNYSSADYLSQD